MIDSSKIEKDKVIENEEKDVAASGLRIINISKTYRKLPFGIESKRDCHAVKNVYIEVQKNELLCLLGHNGAGKSTLFNMMTGIIAPTEGSAKVCDLDIADNQDIIRKISGVVP